MKFTIWAIIGAITAVTITGCTFLGEPRTRLASYATATAGTKFIDSNNLGEHCYEHFVPENNGIVYTCRGGHIDIAHLRIAADYVKYLYGKAKRTIKNDKARMKFKLNVESSMYYVDIQYPQNWADIKNDQLIEEVSLELAQNFAFTMTTWHEFLTWYGFKCIALWPEDASAFSWEDIYSNLLGVRLGVSALQNESYSFNKAMTKLLKDQLDALQPRDKGISRYAAEKMQGDWYDGSVFVTIRQRNIDIGLDDGMVTPTLVPGICEGAKPKPYPVPSLDKVECYGFKIHLEIEPREFEKGKILRIIYPDGDGKRVIPEKHFPILFDDMAKEAAKKGYTLWPNNDR